MEGFGHLKFGVRPVVFGRTGGGDCCIPPFLGSVGVGVLGIIIDGDFGAGGTCASF